MKLRIFLIGLFLVSLPFTGLVHGEIPKIEMVSIPAGEFQMGSNKAQAISPVHTVRVSSFLLGKTEVTQGLWQEVMGNNPDYFKKGDTYPVGNVSWDDCQKFIQKLNQMTGGNYRLPTEAEWEYAARAGTTGNCYGDKAIPFLFERDFCPVGQKMPNAFGLYDILGGVMEWCSDWYGKYSASSQSDPIGPSFGDGRVVRGGDRCGVTGIVNAHWRESVAQDAVGYRYIGFRLAADHPGTINENKIAQEKANLEKENTPEGRLAKATVKMKMEYDEFEETTEYEDKKLFDHLNSVHLSIVKKKGMKPKLRFCIDYFGSSWLFIKSYSIKTDNKTYEIRPPSYNSVNRTNGSDSVYEIYETALNQTTFAIIKDIIKSKKILMRIYGKDSYSDRTIDEEEKEAFQNVLDAYKALGGVGYF